jgi:hypothetical protein
LAGQTSAFHHQRNYTEAGNKIHAIANSQMSRKASVPEGYAPYAYTLPVLSGGMSGFPRIATISATPALIAGSTVAGTATLTLTGESSASIITAMVGAYTLTLTPNAPELKLTLGLVGAYGFLLGGIGSLAIIDPMTGSWSMTLTPIADLKGILSVSGEFRNSDDAVTVDYQGAVYVADWGSDGFTYPAGTATSPVQSIAAADFIATKYGLKTYYVKGDFTLSRGYTNVIFNGWGPLQFNRINLNDQILDSVLFENCVVEGKLNTTAIGGEGWQATIAKVEFKGCYLQSIEDLQGICSHSQIDGLTLLNAGGWFSSSDTVIEGDNTVFDMRSTPGTTLSMDVNSGWTQVINAVTGCLLELNVKGGEVSLDASCTGGEYYLEGVGTLFNDSAMEKKENHFIWNEQSAYVREVGSTGALLYGAGGGSSPETIADAVWAKVLP